MTALWTWVTSLILGWSLAKLPERRERSEDPTPKYRGPEVCL
jgi:hypothetical protein